MSVRVIVGDARDRLAELPGESVHCCVTSPPYFGLRDYGVDGQIGLEPSPDEYIAVLVAVFCEVRRVLRGDGTLWLNLGDSYNAYNGGAGPSSALSQTASKQRPQLETGYGLRTKTLKPKDLLMVPARVALALQADGWWLRSDIIWHKPNPMPESVTDRPTSAHEHVFLLAKSERYYFDADAVKEPAIYAGDERHLRPDNTQQARELKQNGTGNRRTTGFNDRYFGTRLTTGKPQAETRNIRNVWTIATAPYSEAHFATFPPSLVEPCIKAGTSERGVCAACGAPWQRETERVDQGYDGSRYGERAVAASGGAKTGGTRQSTLGSSNGKLTGKTATVGWSPSCACGAAVVPATVLDPFGGAGTTGLVADRLGRDCIGIELNPAYAQMARQRIEADAGMFASVAE